MRSTAGPLLEDNLFIVTSEGPVGSARELLARVQDVADAATPIMVAMLEEAEKRKVRFPLEPGGGVVAT